jgi:hypothetical protein
MLDVERPAREIPDPVLGWRYRPGFRMDNDVINNQGLRSERNYAPVREKDVFRVAAFGDSFVYGNEVGTRETWTADIESASPRIEVLNYGVGGYGVDQAYLRYKQEGSNFSPQMVLIGFVPDDLRRVVNVYRRFISDNEVPLFKPRFVLNGTDIQLIQCPVRSAADYDYLISKPDHIRKFGVRDHWYKPAVYENPLYDLSATIRLAVAVGMRVYDRYFDPNRLLKNNKFNTDSEAFKLQISIFRQFSDEVRRNGAAPMILLFPDRYSVESVRSGSNTVYEPLASRLSEAGLSHLDIGEAFRSERAIPVESLFMPGGHYSPLGNQIIARWLLPKLEGARGRDPHPNP